MKLGLVALALLVSTSAWARPQAKPGIGRYGAKPGDAKAYLDRGTRLYGKGDFDGAIAELRESIRLKPDLAEAHNHLGAALEAKGDRQAALEEYRKAFELDPKNDVFRADYERLSKELKK